MEQGHARREQRGYGDEADEHLPGGLPNGLPPAADLLPARLEPGQSRPQAVEAVAGELGVATGCVMLAWPR